MAISNNQTNKIENVLLAKANYGMVHEDFEELTFTHGSNATSKPFVVFDAVFNTTCWEESMIDSANMFPVEGEDEDSGLSVAQITVYITDGIVEVDHPLLANSAEVCKAIASELSL